MSQALVQWHLRGKLYTATYREWHDDDEDTQGEHGVGTEAEIPVIPRDRKDSWSPRTLGQRHGTGIRGNCSILDFRPHKL